MSSALIDYIISIINVSRCKENSNREIGYICLIP